MTWIDSRGSDRTSRTLGPTVAGSWYPADPSALTQRVDELLAAAPEPSGASEILAVVAPHAGFDYSGKVAAHAFRPLRGLGFRRAVVLGPSHYLPFRGAVVPDADAYRTPLGTVPLDLGALDTLRVQPGFATNNAAFAREHSLEAEIPFLQRVLDPGFTLVLVLVGGGSSGPAALEIAQGLEPLLDDGTLLVASSDFTHFGESFGYRPFRDDVEEKIRDLDLGVIRCVEAGDVDALESYLARTGATVCGRDALSVMLRALPAGRNCELAAYDASGRMTGDWTHSVSYAALVLRAGSARNAR